MKVLMISIDKGLLGRGQLGDVVERHREYGKYVEKLDIIVLCKKGFEKFRISQNVKCYPTNSPSKISMTLDALDFGKTLFKENHYDLIVTQDPFFTGWVGLRLKKLFGAKLLAHLHGDFFENPHWLKENWKNRFLLLFAKRIIRQADGIRVMSNGQKEKLLTMGIDESKVRVISTPVRFDTYLSPNHEAVKEFRSHGKPIILHVGRNDVSKDFETLWKALRVVCSKNPHVLFWQVGAGLNMKEVREKIPEAAFRLDPIVEKNSLINIYHAVDIVVLSSTSESFGKVLVEANACGKPVVSTATTGAKEIIEDGKNGFLVPIGNAHALAEKILWLLEHPKEAEEMGKYGQRIVKEKYSENVEKVIAFWKSLVEAGLRSSTSKSSFETILILIFLSLSFLIGIWHAFPMLNVISDEMYFVGGVLRAMENKTLIPAPGDVPYGTLTYFLNYILVGIFLAVLLPFFRFQLSDLKFYLVQNPEVAFFIPRFLSAILAVVYLVFIYKLLKKEVSDVRMRLVLILLLFTNMLTTLVLHTGKMWVLSILLVIISFYYLYHALLLREGGEPKTLSRKLFYSVLFSFLALANFPLNVFSLINIPILFWHFRKKRFWIIKIIQYSIFGFAVCAVIIFLNFSSIKDQVLSIFTDYRPLAQDTISGNLSIPESFLLHIKKLIAFFPLLFLMLVFAIRDGIKNRVLCIISLCYFISYLIVISVVATWSTGLYTFIHYSYPFSFFLLFLLASFRMSFRKGFYVIAGTSVLYYFFTLYYLSIPTTYNQARNWIIKNLSSEDVVIYNDVSRMELPKNKQTSLIVKDYFCATKCKNVIEHDLNSDFTPLIIDKYTREDAQQEIQNNTKLQYYVVMKFLENSGGFTLVKSFESGIKESFELEGRMANYFDLDFFRIKRFGPTLFIYKKL